MQIGFGLISVVDVQQGGDCLGHIQSIRRQVAQNLGVIVPSMNITDNLKLGSRLYSILLKGVEIAGGELMTDRFLAINPGNTTVTIQGTPNMNYTVADPVTVLATHLTETIRGHAYASLGNKEVKARIDYVAETHPKLTEELVPNTLSVSEIQKGLQIFYARRFQFKIS